MAGAGIGVIAAQSGGTGQATQQLQELGDKGSDRAVVATVNSDSITRREVDVAQALTAVDGLKGPDGAAAGQTRDEILQGLIDSRLLSQAAAKSGTRVSEDEVTAWIQNAVVGPYNAPTFPEQQRKLIDAQFRAMGTSVAQALTAPIVRAAYRRIILTSRWLNATGQDRQSILARLRGQADVQVFPAVLNERR